MKVAVIPARGGSKRLPRKNILPFAGKPIVAHSIECALRSGLFDRVIISTDDAEIAEVSRSHGAEVPFLRPAELSDDHTGTVDVIAHAVDWLQQHDLVVTAVCCIYATAPFIRPSDLAAGLRELESGNWNFVFSATSFAFSIFRSFRLNADGRVTMFFPEEFTTRSQDLPHALHDAAQFYWGRPSAWLERKPIFDVRSTVIAIPRWRVQDIDTPEDWERAQRMWRILQEPEGS